MSYLDPTDLLYVRSVEDLKSRMASPTPKTFGLSLTTRKWPDEVLRFAVKI